MGPSIVACSHLFQIESLLFSKSKKSHKGLQSEITQLKKEYNPELEKHFVRCLFFLADQTPYDSKLALKDFNQFLLQEFNKLTSRPSFVSLLCFAFENPLQIQDPYSFDQFHSFLSQNSSFTCTNELILALSLTQSCDIKLASQAKQWTKQKLCELINTPLVVVSSTGSSKSQFNKSPSNQSCIGSLKSRLESNSNLSVLQQTTVDSLHFILHHLNEDYENYNVNSELFCNWILSLHREFPKNRVPIVLSPHLYSDAIGLPLDVEFSHEPSLQSLVSVAMSQSISNSDLIDVEPQLLIDDSEKPQSDRFLNDAVSSPISTLTDPCIVADLLEELGYDCTKSLSRTRLVLSEFSSHELTEAAVAKCLCLFLRSADGQLNKCSIYETDDGEETVSGCYYPIDDGTESGNLKFWMCLGGLKMCDTKWNSPISGMTDLGTDNDTEFVSTWNVENFLVIVNEINPSLRMNQVLSMLDCAEFAITSRASFILLKQFLSHTESTHSSLPVDLFYAQWTNAYGHYSLLNHCFYYPDIICLASLPFRCVDLTEYHLAQDEDQMSSQIWKNIDYVQALLRISERALFDNVYGMLKQAFCQCPDIVTATLLETSPCPLRSMMLNHAFMYFLTPRRNSQIILQSAWIGAKASFTPGDLQNERHLLIAACIEYVNQLSSGISEPNTLHELTNTGIQGTLTKLIELLASITDPNMKAYGILPLLLGTSEAVSNSICSLLYPAQTNAMIPAVKPLPFYLLPPITQSLDMVLVLVVCMANAVSSTNPRTGNGYLQDTNATLTSVQTGIKQFLAQWFGEHFRDKKIAELYALGVIDYLRVRYLSPIISGSASIPLPIHSALPIELKNPPAGLLLHILQSLQTALRSNSCTLSRTVITETRQSLDTLQLLINPGLNRAQNPAFNPLSSMKVSTTDTNQLHASTPRVTGSMTSSNIPYQTANLTTVSGFQTCNNKFPVNMDNCTNSIDGLSRNLSATSLSNKPNLSGLLSHVANPLTLQLAARRKAQSSGVVSGTTSSSDGLQALGNNNNFLNNAPLPLEHPPMELTFANQPIDIQLSSEVEAKANTFFQRLLQGISPPDEIFKTVYEFATQGSTSQRKLLDGILRMLADEVSQHLQDYPEQMLPLIADLYGNILAASTRLFSMQALSILWRAVLTRLSRFPPDDVSIDTPLFRAVVLILSKAKNTFAHFTNLPNCLVTCPVFKLLPHDLQGYIVNAEVTIFNYSMTQQSASQGLATTTGSNQTGHFVGHFANPEPTSQTGILTLTTCTTSSDSNNRQVEQPEESVSDRIYFLINNVSKINVKEKSSDLADILSDECLLPWFAFYLVTKRIPVEHNFHDLFALVLDHVQDRLPTIRSKVMQELIRCIKQLLRNVRLDRDDMQARTTLKHLGSFLGLITLARNKPLLHDDLNIKDLIYEAYHKGTIPAQYVVPFVARIVRAATESVVFKPPNPWTMAILKVLRELYDMENVKDSLRFEIEILYRAFDFNLNDIPPAHFLRDSNHASNLDVELCFLAPIGQSSATNAITTVTTTTVVSNTVTSGESTCYPNSNTSISTASEQVVSTVTSSALVPVTLTSSFSSLQQRQMLNMLSMLQKQQVTVSLNQTVADILTNASGQQPVYSTSDLANLVHNNTGANSGSGRLGAMQQKHIGQTTASQLTPSCPTNLPIQQQQFAAAVAALQQQQQNQSTHPVGSSLTQIPSINQVHGLPGVGSASAAPSVNELGSTPLTGHLLRYEDVGIRSIHACLNLDELFSSAPVNTRSASLAILQANPRLRILIEPAIVRAVNELTIPVFERCARITVTTVAAIVRKDFALDPDPKRVLFAACQMIRHLAAGMSLITAREALGISLITALKNIILAEVQSASGQEKEAVQQLAHLVVSKSMHVCLAYMQKSVAEKAVKDVEKKLEADIRMRTELGPRRFLEQAANQLSVQQSSMPESLRLSAGGPNTTEMAVYEEFGRSIPGFAHTSHASPFSTTAPSFLPSLNFNTATAGQANQPVSAIAAYLQLSASQKHLSSGAVLQRPSSVGPSASLIKPPGSFVNQTPNQHQMLALQQQQQQNHYQNSLSNPFDKIINQIERHLVAISSRLRSTNDPICQSLRCLMDAIHLTKSNRDTTVMSNLISIMVHSFLEYFRPSFWRDQPRGLEIMEYLKEVHMLTLRHMLSLDQPPFGCAWVTRQVTHVWIHMDGGSAHTSLPTNNNTVSSEPNKVLDSESGSSMEHNMNPNSDNNTRSGWKTMQFADNAVNRFQLSKWNWEAFAELLRVHVICLSQVDSYLAQEVTKAHPGAITFVIDLLDHFVLPCPVGTSLGAAAAAAASYARSNAVNNSSKVAGNNPNSVNTQSANVLNTQTKREFTVLNEYDLWSTLEVMLNRVNSLNINLTDPLGLRLKLARARVRGLLDLGLFEQSPLFAISPTTIGALYSGCSQAHEFDDPPNLQEKVELLMRNWFEIYQSTKQRDPSTIEALLNQLTQFGVFPNTNNLTRFIRLATIFVIGRNLKQLKLHEQQSSAGLLSGACANRVVAYVELDAYSRLIAIIINQVGELQQSDLENAKIVLLNKVLGLIVGTLLQEHEVRRDWFHPMPFERILVMLFVELQSPTSVSPVTDTSIIVSPGSDTVNNVEGSTENPNSDAPIGAVIAESDKVYSSKSADTQNEEKLITNSSNRSCGNLTFKQQLPLVFCHSLHCIRPERATAFVFSWLEMLAHRWFVGHVLAAPGSPKLRAAYQALYAQLLVDLLKFLGYFLQNALMPKPIQCLYKATLRLMLVLIHDFPEFVSDYYALFCDVVPSNSIQMRNLILSALPKRGIPSADPLQALPVDHLASVEDPTGYCMDAGSRLPEPMRRELDIYLATRTPLKLLSELVTMLRRTDDVFPPLPPQFVYHPHQQALAAYAAALTSNESSVDSCSGKNVDRASDENSVSSSVAQNKPQVSLDGSETHDNFMTDLSINTVSRSVPGGLTTPAIGSSSTAAAALLWGVRATQQLATFGLADNMHYNIELMTNLTLYVCITAIRSLREKGMPLNMSTIAHTPQMDIIQSLVLNLDNEGRYLFLNCMANQLRYPNSHTYYFSYTILYLFSEQSKEQVKEQISRVLMERLIVNRPHPWGLLMTSAELLRNPNYHFWEHEFARCNPEIEAMVTIVARSCIPNFQIPTVCSNSNSNDATSDNNTSLCGSLSSPIAQSNRRQPSPLAHNAATIVPNVSVTQTPLLTE